MSKGIKKIVLAMLSLVFVLSISLAVNANNFKAYAGTESATISTFDVSDVQIRSVEPTGIRFSTKVNKDYLDQDLSGKDVKFGTLIIPVDFFAKSEQAELTHAVADVMDVEQTTWGAELEDYYVFNAVLINMPSSEYGRELMARSYAIIDGGEPIYSETTVTKSIGQVASEILVKYPAEEIEEEKEFFEAYVNESLKSVAFNEDAIELAINETMPLSATTNPANYAVVYSVDDPSVISLENGVVKGLKTGVANVTATVGAISDTIEVTVKEPTAEWGTLKIAANNANLSIENGVYKMVVVTNPVLRLYHNDLSAFNAGDIVNVKITYKLTGASNDYCFYGPTATGALGLLPARDTLSNTGVQQSISITTIVSNTDGAVSTDNTSGSNAKNIALSLWVGAGSIFEIIDVEIVSQPWGLVETVRGTTTQTLENGNVKIVAAGSTEYRLYANALTSYNAGDAVSVKITYKISNLGGGKQDMKLYGPNQTGALAVSSSVFTASAGEQSIVYNTVVSNTAGVMSATNTGGTNAKNIVLNPWIDNAGYTLEIINVEVVSASWGIAEVVDGNATQALDNGNVKIVATNNATYRLYVNALSSYNAGDAVSVKITYKISNLGGGKQDMKLYGPNQTGALAVSSSVFTASAGEQSIVYNTVVSNTAGVMSATNTGGTNAKNIVLNPWIDNAGYTLEIINVEVVSASWGIAEIVGGSATQSLENGNIKIVATNNATYRLYVNALSSYDAGSAVKVTIAYKISNLGGGTQDLGIYAPNTSSALGLVSARGTLVADGNTQSVTYNTVVSNTSGVMSATNTGGTNAKNIVLNPWIDNKGYTLEIINVTISPV